MASRNIAITEDIYHQLERRKQDGESFTGVIKRLLETRGRPSDHFGAWEDLTERDLEAMRKARKELRESWQERGLDPQG